MQIVLSHRGGSRVIGASKKRKKKEKKKDGPWKSRRGNGSLKERRNAHPHKRPRKRDERKGRKEKRKEKPSLTQQQANGTATPRRALTPTVPR